MRADALIIPDMKTKEIIRDPLTIEFVKEVQEYADACGLKLATVADKAVGNSKLFSRYDDGSDISYHQRVRVRSYIAANPPKKPQSDEVAA